MQTRCPLVEFTFSEAHSSQQLFSLIDYDHRVDPIALFMWKMHHNHALPFHHSAPAEFNPNETKQTVHWLVKRYGTV